MSKARKKHKYIARVLGKNNKYRYFYVQSEYEAYLLGVQKGKLSSDYKISDSEREDIKNTKKLEKQYGDQVYRSADEYEAQVVKEKKSTIKGFTYAIRTGKRHVVVRSKGQVLYDRTVFVAPQETKKISLP